MARRIFVTGDTHFGHVEAISLFARPVPLGDVAAMDEFLLERINRRVGKRDRLIHIGDFTGPMPWKGDEGRASMEYARGLRAKIACAKVELILGNHDPSPKRAREIFDDARRMMSWRGWSGGDERIICCHYPLRTWQGVFNGAMHLYGHMHGAFEPVGRSLDVGVDCWDYGPVPLDDVLAILAAIPSPRREECLPRRQPMRKVTQPSASI